MADELPLAEVRAVITSIRKAKNFSASLLVFEDEDKRQMCNLALGPSGDKVVLVTFRQCPPDWEAGPVDPNQADEDVDVISQLEEEWRGLQSRMTADADLQP